MKSTLLLYMLTKISDCYIEILYKFYKYNRQFHSELFDDMLRYYDYQNDGTLLGYITEYRLKHLKEKFISGENGFFSTLIKICECLQPLKNRKIELLIEYVIDSLKN